MQRHTDRRRITTPNDRLTEPPTVARETETRPQYSRGGVAKTQSPLERTRHSATYDMTGWCSLTRPEYSARVRATGTRERARLSSYRAVVDRVTIDCCLAQRSRLQRPRQSTRQPPQPALFGSQSIFYGRLTTVQPPRTVRWRRRC